MEPGWGRMAIPQGGSSPLFLSSSFSSSPLLSQRNGGSNHAEWTCRLHAAEHSLVRAWRDIPLLQTALFCSPVKEQRRGNWTGNSYREQDRKCGDYQCFSPLLVMLSKINLTRAASEDMVNKEVRWSKLQSFSAVLILVSKTTTLVESRVSDRDSHRVCV